MAVAISVIGSPPRGRGKGRRVVDHHPLPGITPAWAGKSKNCSGHCSAPPDHPRMGGEKSGDCPRNVFSSGSPPRGRGKENSFQIFTYARRITPAWAGKSCSICSYRTAGQDHPRMGGEKPCTQRPAVCDIGSPPHGRGKVALCPNDQRTVRITPAWAGKSFAMILHIRANVDHPRMGGEKCVPVSWATGTKGSPPHGRGKASLPAGLWLADRITPAWAGKSCCKRCYRCISGDHPRMGGEKQIFIF